MRDGSLSLQPLDSDGDGWGTKKGRVQLAEAAE